MTSGTGTAEYMSYIFYDGKYWVVHSDTTHLGRQIYQIDQYHGRNIVKEISLTAEYWDRDMYDEDSDFTYNGDKISMKEFEELRWKILGI